MKEKKEKQINIRVNQIEFDELENKSKELKITKSEFILKLIFGEKIKKDNSKDSLKYLNAIIKIGNNINQIARLLNSKNLKNEIADDDYSNLLDKLIIIETNLQSIYKEVSKWFQELLWKVEDLQII